MSEVQIHQTQSEEEKVLSLSRQTDALYEEIGLKAFLRFEARGGLHGYDREDWLEAERSLIFAPPVELVDKGDEFTIRIAVPGFDAGHLHVNVLPRAIILNGDAAKSGGPRKPFYCRTSTAASCSGASIYPLRSGPILFERISKTAY